MQKRILLLILFLANTLLFAQKPDSQSLLDEGKHLYHLEKASWYATDIFLADYPQLKDSLNGYLSYQTEDGNVNTIFYNLSGSGKILARYEFASTSYQDPVSVDINHFQPTDQEKDLIALREDALNQIKTNPDRFFTYYKNASFNLDPVITPTERKVYVLTGPQVDGVVLIGNDYLLTYNNKNELTAKAKLHNSLIHLPCKAEKTDKPLVSTMHSHVVTDCITPTDICTLLLYKDFVEWTEHTVISKEYVSILDIKNEKLTILTRQDWDKMGSDKK